MNQRDTNMIALGKMTDAQKYNPRLVAEVAAVNIEELKVLRKSQLDLKALSDEKREKFAESIRNMKLQPNDLGGYVKKNAL